MNCKVLIVDSLTSSRTITRERLRASCYDTLVAGDGESALSCILSDKPDIVLLRHSAVGTAQQEQGIDAPGTCRKIRDMAQLAHLPIMVILPADITDLRLSSWRAGADMVIVHALDDSSLTARLRSLMRSTIPPEARQDIAVSATTQGLPCDARPPPIDGRIVLIPASQSSGMLWRHRARPGTQAQLHVLSRESALSGRLPTPDLYIIEHSPLTSETSLNLLAELRARPDSCHAAICFMVRRNDHPACSLALDLGADDILLDLVQEPEVSLQLRRIVHRRQQMTRYRARIAEGMRLSLTDPLTGLSNRRHALPVMNRILDEAARQDLPCAVMVIDIDNFKSINDHHGHGTGDHVLIEVSRRLASLTSPQALLARIGGEEFLMVSRIASLRRAHAMAEAMRRIISEDPILVANLSVPVTISIGLTLATPQSATGIPELLESADLALLEAKAEGRNQVILNELPAA